MPDGTIGTLVTANTVDWNFLITDGNLTLQLSPTNSSVPGTFTSCRAKPLYVGGFILRGFRMVEAAWLLGGFSFFATDPGEFGDSI